MLSVIACKWGIVPLCMDAMVASFLWNWLLLEQGSHLRPDLRVRVMLLLRVALMRISYMQPFFSCMPRSGASLAFVPLSRQTHLPLDMLRPTPQPCQPAAQVARGAASHGRCGTQVSKGSWLSQQLASSPVSHCAPVSVGRAVSGGQPEAARVCPWGCNEPLPRSGWIFLGCCWVWPAQHAPYIKDLFSLCPDD